MTDNPKDIMRREAKRHRDRIDLVDGDGDAAADLFMETMALRADQIVALYWPKGREFDTLPLMERLLTAGVTCALPVVVKDEWLLRFVAWNDGDALVDGPYGLKQPPVDENTAFVEPDIFVVPLLAFDRRGNRLGYGGGYYDETLRHYRAMKDVTAVGYGYAEQAVLFNLPAEDHDQKLDVMITPRGVQRFTI